MRRAAGRWAEEVFMGLEARAVLSNACTAARDAPTRVCSPALWPQSAPGDPSHPGQSGHHMVLKMLTFQ
jgi:hypothetical protein